MSKESISHKELKIILNYNPETGLFTNIVRRGSNAEIGSAAGSINSEGYTLIKIAGTSYKAHRLAWFYTYDAWPEEIDHINRIKTDNRIANLSSGTRSANQHNRGIRSTNKSGYTGVSFNTGSNTWVANITINSKRVYLGSFKDIDNAVSARKEAEINHK